jgi:hypothetical protein
MLLLELSPLEKLGAVVECPGFLHCFYFCRITHVSTGRRRITSVGMDDQFLWLDFHMQMTVSLGVWNVVCSFLWSECLSYFLIRKLFSKLDRSEQALECEETAVSSVTAAVPTDDAAAPGTTKLY